MEWNIDQRVPDQQKTTIRCLVRLTAIVTTMGFPRRPLTLRLLQRHHLYQPQLMVWECQNINPMLPAVAFIKTRPRQMCLTLPLMVVGTLRAPAFICSWPTPLGMSG